MMDGRVDLKDTVIVLQILSGVSLPGPVAPDVTIAGAVGLQDAVFSLQVAAETRTAEMPVYGAGYAVSTETGLDAAVVKIDGLGNQRWLRLLTTSATDEAKGVAADAADRVYVTGQTFGPMGGRTNAGSGDAFVARLDPGGGTDWVVLLGTTMGDAGYALTAGATDGVIVVGGTEGTLGAASGGGSLINQDVFVAKLDSSGTTQWITQIGTTCSEWATGVAIDITGNVYVTGSIFMCAFAGNTAAGGWDVFLAKLNPEGEIAWIRQAGTANGDKAAAVTVDGNGAAYMTGYWDATISTPGDSEGGSIFVAKYDGTGNLQWLKTNNGGYSWGNRGTGVAAYGGYVYVTGTTQGDLVPQVNPNWGEDDLFLMRYDAAGNRP